MISRTRNEWYSLWQVSGKSKADFCRENNLSYWKLMLANKKTVEQKFVEFKLPAEKASGLDIVCKLGGLDLRLHWQFN